jgi:hypothetical protein
LALAAILAGLLLTSVCLHINRKVEHLLRERRRLGLSNPLGADAPGAGRG